MALTSLTLGLTYDVLLEDQDYRRAAAQCAIMCIYHTYIRAVSSQSSDKSLLIASVSIWCRDITIPWTIWNHVSSLFPHSTFRCRKTQRHGRKAPGVGYILQEFNGTWCRSKKSKDDLSSSMYIKVFTTLVAIPCNWLVNKSSKYQYIS